MLTGLATIFKNGLGTLIISLILMRIFYPN
jgi:hypothetical protein